jgi:hypothetical protein
MKRLLAILLVAGLGPSCGPGSGGSFISFNLVVPINLPDTFTLTGVATDVSGSATYLWDCSANQANITLGTAFTNGTIRLQVWDGNGMLVHDNKYEATLAGGLTAFTAANGASGLWTLKFTFRNAMWAGDIVLTADTTPNPDAITIGGTGSQDSVLKYEPGWTANDVKITVAGMTSGIVAITMWDGNGTKVYEDIFFGIAGMNDTVSGGAAGTWLVRIEFDSCLNVGAITISQ